MSPKDRLSDDPPRTFHKHIVYVYLDVPPNLLDKHFIHKPLVCRPCIL